jgi:hypothetical protein
VQCMPQLAGWHALSAVTTFTLKDMHDLSDPIESDAGALGLSVPDPPVQALDLIDDRCFRLDPSRLVGRQSARRMLRVLQPHGDVKQSAIGGFMTPAATRIDCRPGQPSVNAVTAVSAVRPTVSRLRRISIAISVSVLATAPKTCRPPSDVSTLPMRTSRWRSSSWQPRMNVESTVTVIADAATIGLATVPSRRCLPTLSVCPRNVSGLFPASTGKRCANTPAATR